MLGLAWQRSFLSAYSHQHLGESPLAAVFMARHSLSHWHTRARLSLAAPVRLATPASWLCRYDRRRLTRLLHGAALAWQTT